MSNKHERLADRFADIFIRLHSNERLNTANLAHEYGVCDKTIRRDLARLESYLPLIRERGVVYIDNTRQFDLTHKEFGELIKLIGVHHLLPNMDIGFLRELIQQKTDGLFQIKGYEYENSVALRGLIDVLREAIAKNTVVLFDYKDKIRTVHPYKLINHRGCWYVIGTQHDEIKTYRLSKILNLNATKQQFIPDEQTKNTIEQNDGIWFGNQEITVLVRADNYAGGYFIQKQILPKQKILQSLDDGGLLIESTVYYPSQIFPMIRSWIPHLTIIEPKEWQDELEKGLREYLTSNNLVQ